MDANTPLDVELSARRARCISARAIAEFLRARWSTRRRALRDVRGLELARSGQPLEPPARCHQHLYQRRRSRPGFAERSRPLRQHRPQLARRRRLRHADQRLWRGSAGHPRLPGAAASTTAANACASNRAKDRSPPIRPSLPCQARSWPPSASDLRQRFLKKSKPRAGCRWAMTTSSSSRSKVPKNCHPARRLFAHTDRTATAGYHIKPFGWPMIEAYFGGACARRSRSGRRGCVFRFRRRRTGRCDRQRVCRAPQTASDPLLGRRPVRARRVFVCSCRATPTAAPCWRSPSMIGCSLPAKPARRTTSPPRMAAISPAWPRRKASSPRVASRGLCEIFLDDPPIDRGQRDEIGDRHAFVDLRAWSARPGRIPAPGNNP